MHWPTQTTPPSTYKSAQHPTKQEARLHTLQHEHTTLQEDLKKYHAAIHIRLLLLDMLSPPPSPHQVKEWLQLLDDS